MRGQTTSEDLKKGLFDEGVIAREIESFTGKKLTKCSEMLGDFRSESGSVYELKSDPLIGKSQYVMMELFASFHPDRFEKGWSYRYENVDFMCFYNDNGIWLYDWRHLKKFMWNNIFNPLVSVDWKIVLGVRNNRECMVALIPKSEAEKFLRKTIPRRIEWIASSRMTAG